MHSTDTYTNGSINLTPEPSIFFSKSKDTSINTYSSVVSLEKVSKRFSSCRAAYTGYSKSLNKLKPLNSQRPTKITIDHLQDYNQRLKRSDLPPQEHPPQYHKEINAASSIHKALLPLRKALQSKLSSLNLSSVSDFLLSAETFSQMLVKSPWFIEKGRIQTIENFQYFEKLMLNRIEGLIDYICELKEKIGRNDRQGEEKEEILAENLDLRRKVTESSKFGEKYLKKVTGDLKVMKKRERGWNIEKVRLEEEISALKRVVEQSANDNLQDLGSEKDEEISKKNQIIEGLNAKVEGLGYRLIKTQFECAQNKDKVQESLIEIASLESKLKSISHYKDLFISHQHSSAQLKSLLSERLLMQHEEILSLTSAKHELTSLKLSVKSLQQRLEDLSSSQVCESKQDEYTTISLQESLFQLSTTFGEPNNPSITPLTYKISRPTFSEMLSIPSIPDAVYYPPFKNWLHLMIRGLYDSKFYEHSLLHSSPNSAPTRFVDFVFAWISSYGIDENTRAVTELEWWKKEKVNEIRFMMLLGLGEANCKGNWEIWTFKEFLSENFLLDDLGFFLHCRYLILKSPQLSSTVGKYSKIHMVNMETVNSALEGVMRKLSPEEYSKLLAILKTKVKKDRVVPTIDLAIVLRVCLEFFRQEKRQKFVVIQKLFEKAPKETNGQVAFYSFRSICKNLSPDLSEYEIARFYRDAYSLSKQHITPEYFFLLANELGIFYKTLKLSGSSNLADITRPESFKKKTNAHSRKIQEILEAFKNGDKQIEMLKSGIDNMGIQDLSEKFNRFAYLLLNSNNLPIEEFWVWNLEDIYHRFWSLVVTTQSSFIECNSQDVKLLAYKLTKEQNNENDINNIKKAAEKFTDILFAMNIRRIKDNLAARKIQHSWKIKASKNINFIATVVKSVQKFKDLPRLSA